LFNGRTHTIDRYLDGSMPESERDEFEQRCFEDNKLFLQLRERAELRERVTWILQKNGKKLLEEGARPPASSKAISRGTRFTPFLAGHTIRWAYGIAGIAVLSIGLLFLLRHNVRTFAVNDELERELGPRILRAAQVTVLSPQLSSQVDDEITFAWETANKGPFEVIILDHNGNEILSYLTKAATLSCSPPLKPGLYYWKLLSQDDWIFTGKFNKVK
jgi:hypothetical protein